MCEQIISEQSLPERPATPKVKGLVITSLILLALAAILDLTATGLLADPQTSPLLLPSAIGENAQWIASGLLLPLSLLLLSTSTQRARLSKVFMIVSVVFLSVQLLSAAFGAFGTQLYQDNFSLAILWQRISGCKLFIVVSPMVIALIREGGNDAFVVQMVIRYALTSLSGLLYILPNVLSLIGFAKLSSAK